MAVVAVATRRQPHCAAGCTLAVLVRYVDPVRCGQTGLLNMNGRTGCQAHHQHQPVWARRVVVALVDFPVQHVLVAVEDPEICLACWFVVDQYVAKFIKVFTVDGQRPAQNADQLGKLGNRLEEHCNLVRPGVQKPTKVARLESLHQRVIHTVGHLPYQIMIVVAILVSWLTICCSHKN